jgi:hypothetical protein
MRVAEEIRRLEEKSLDGQLLWELENGFELSPRESQEIVETVRLHYEQQRRGHVGQVSVWVVRREASVGKPLSDVPKVRVWVTLDGGQEDLEAYEAYGQEGLRRQRLLRITEEVLDQGGVATQEDLVRLLGSSIRTIRRDISYLRKQGLRVVTRGVYSDIGPSVSHKIVIVEMYLKGMVYTEISRRTRHSAKAIKRYVGTFGRVTAMYVRGIREVAEIAHYGGISERLAREYVKMYKGLRKKPSYRVRIEDLLRQLSGREVKKGAMVEVGR